LLNLPILSKSIPTKMTIVRSALRAVNGRVAAGVTRATSVGAIRMGTTKIDYDDKGHLGQRAFEDDELHFDVSDGFRANLIGTDEYREAQMDPHKDQRGQHYINPKKKAIRVAVTGAAGNIGYAMLFRIASGEVFGRDQPVIINCIELPHAMDALKGVAMELDDCAFPLVQHVLQTDDQGAGFDDIDYAFLVGSKPRGPGMERGDLLKDNGAIFKEVGQNLNKYAKKSVRVAVVGNPANTNCLIAASNAPDLDAKNFSALTRLDHDRGLAQIADKTLCPVTDIEKFIIWGNHSPTMYPDVHHVKIHGQPIAEVVGQEDMYQWLEAFEPRVQQRGAEIIGARGQSSAASAANGAMAAVRDWHFGTGYNWVSAAVPSDGSYGIDEGVYFSYPVTYDQTGKYEIVQSLEINPYSAERIEKTKKELFAERDAVKDLL